MRESGARAAHSGDVTHPELVDAPSLAHDGQLPGTELLPAAQDGRRLVLPYYQYIDTLCACGYVPRGRHQRDEAVVPAGHPLDAAALLVHDVYHGFCDLERVGYVLCK